VGYLHTTVAAAVPSTADFYDAASPVDLTGQLGNRRPWVKLYMPSEEGDSHPIETYLVSLDCGATDPEAARALSDTIRQALARSTRSPGTFRRLRVVGLDEGTFYRVQLTYRVQRPAL
jgi:hypothetical protein